MTDRLTLLILAGGASRRMGRDKATLPVGEATLVEHLARRLAGVADEALVAGGLVGKRWPGLRQVADRYPGRGPLAGMHAGLVEARHPLVWVVACDLPEVVPALGPFLAAAAVDVDAVVPRVAERPQPLCAVYRSSAAPLIERLLEEQRLRVSDFLDAIRVRFVDEASLRQVDDRLESFRNLNTPADYEAWLRQGP